MKTRIAKRVHDWSAFVLMRMREGDARDYDVMQLRERQLMYARTFRNQFPMRPRTYWERRDYQLGR